jgi:molybdopterin converting factor small subunit
MDPQFQDLASQIADAVEERLSATVDERLRTHVEALDERVAARHKTFELRLFDSFEARIKTHIDQFEQRAELRMQMHFENLEGKVTNAAEGYGATLKNIERDLADLNKKVDIKFRDNDLVLSNHNQRIRKLEEPQ